MTLRAREVLAITTVVLLVVVVATAAHLAAVARLSLAGADHEGEMLAHQLFHHSARVLMASRKAPVALLRRDPGIRSLLEGMVGYSHTVLYAAITDPSGLAMVHSDPSREGRLLPPRERLDSVRSWGALRVVAAMVKTPQTYEAQMPIDLDGRPFGVVRVGISTTFLRREVNGALVTILVLAAAALVVAIAVGLGAGHFLLRSLHLITQGMDRLVRGEVGPPLDLTRDDELGRIAARVNRLGEEIQKDRSRLQSERTQMEGILNTLEDAVVVLNAEHAVVFCNPRAETILGRRLDEMIARPLDAVLAPPHALLDVVADLFGADRELRNAPLRASGTDGRSQELVVSSYHLPNGGGILALRDLDPVRAVQSLVRYSQKLAALGHLTAGVAHEVKNPLNAMRIHLEVLRTRMPDRPPEVSENLDIIAMEIDRLDRVVQGFLKFVRPQDLRLGPLALNALVEEVARLTAPEAAQHAVRLDLDLDAGNPVLTADAELVKQACANLVANAIQAMPNGGTLTLSTRDLAVSGVLIRVIDEGIGIPEEHLSQIFRLYFTTKDAGSGIGLSLVYRIMEMHDGRIDVESTVGRGTTMTLTFPHASPVAAS
ncbi:MAG: HAMP domain-containing protein [Candidatus Rokubacteria bacterium]|nr:HAMP domain-containing protein [Candidatus Rokubacteria bacterium]